MFADDDSEDLSQEGPEINEEDASALDSDDEAMMEEGSDDDLMGDLQLEGNLADGEQGHEDDSDGDLGELDDEPTAGQGLAQPTADRAAARSQLLGVEDGLDGFGADSMDSDEEAESGDEELDSDEESDDDNELLDIERQAKALDSSR